jgi:hypothetical protein
MTRRRKGIAMHIRAEDLVGPEWAEWYAMTPAERMRESGKLWATFLALGGSLVPEPDTQSPFFDAQAPRERTAHGRAGVNMREDPIVEELHRTREEMLDEHGGLEGLVKHLHTIQAEIPERVVRLEPKRPADGKRKTS